LPKSREASEISESSLKFIAAAALSAHPPDDRAGVRHGLLLTRDIHRADVSNKTWSAFRFG